MKKLSKILVIVLTLAMLLGVVVISASASDGATGITYVSGGNTVQYAANELPKAIEAANKDKNDVVITLNEDITLTADDVMNITKTSGKLTLDLNGKTLDCSAVVATFTVYLTHQTYSSTGVANAYGVAKVRPDADSEYEYYYIKKADDHVALQIEGVDEIVDGGEYTGTVTAGTKVFTMNGFKGVFNVGANAEFSVNGKGGTIKGTSDSKNCIFYTDYDASGAKIYVNDVCIEKSTKVNSPVAYVNNGSMTFDNCDVKATNTGYMFYHSGDAELNLKNSYIHRSHSSYSGNSGFIKLAANTENAAEDGYHIEIENCLIVTNSNVISTTLDDSIYRGNGPSSTATGSNKKKYASSLDNRLRGESYENTAVKFENCNIESSYLPAGKDNYYNRVTYGSILNYDFISCNLFVGSTLITAANHDWGGCGTVNFRDCYIEMTKRQYTSGNLYDPLVVSKLGTSTAVVNMYETELAAADGIVTTSLFDSTGKTYLTLYPGTVFDSTITAAAEGKYKLASGSSKKDVSGKLLVTGFVGISDDATITDNESYTDAIASWGSGGLGGRNPISVLSLGKIRADGLIDPRGNNNLRDNNRVVYQLPGGVAGIMDTQGAISIETESDGNKYFMYDPATVYFGAVYNAGIAAKDGFEAIPESTTVAIDGEHPGYVAAVDGVLTWNIVDEKAEFAADGTYSYSHINDTDVIIAGWDIDLDGIMEYIAIEEADGNLLPDYVNLATTEDAYAMTEIPDAYSEVHERLQLHVGSVSGFDFTKGYMTASLSFDIKRPEGGTFMPINLAAKGRGKTASGSESDSIQYTARINQEGKFYNAGSNGYLITENGSLNKISENTASVQLDNGWNNISVIVDVRLNGSAYEVYSHWFVNGDYVFSSRDDKSEVAATKLDGAVLRIYGISGFEADARFCIDNVVSIQYKNYKNEQLAALLNGDKTNIGTWTDSAYYVSKNQVTELKAEPEKATVSFTAPNGALVTAPYSSIEAALANGAWATVTVKEAPAKAVEVNLPTSVVLGAGVENFKYFSEKYVADANLNFTYARKPSDFATITESYDGESEPTERTYTVGSTVYFDFSEIPAIRKGFVPEMAEKYVLKLDGQEITDELIASLKTEQVLTGDISYVVVKVTEFKYDWAIYTPDGTLIYDETTYESDDMGYGWSSLVKRINDIEKLPDPFSNDENADDIVNGAIISDFEYKIPHTTAGYKIVLFSDFDDANEEIRISSHAKRTVTLDLNGHTVINTKKLTSLFSIYGDVSAWEYAADESGNGKVIEVHSNRTSKKDGQSYKVNDSNSLIQVVENKVEVYFNIVSSELDAKVISNSVYLAYTHGSGTFTIYNTDGTKAKELGYASKYLTIGNEPENSKEIGHDGNAIYIEANQLNYSYKSFGRITYQNVNAKTFADTPLYHEGGYLTVENSTIVANNLYAGMINAKTNGAKDLAIVRSNLISENDARLFYNAYIPKNGKLYIEESRIINLDDGKANSAYITVGSYYNVPYDSATSKNIYFNDERVEENKYTANVYANENVTINGVDYVLTYKVTNDATAQVTWTDKSGNQIGDVDTYLIGATAISYRDVANNDAISNIVYKWADDYGIVTADATFAALDDGTVKAKFKASNSLALYSELLYNFMITKTVNGVDVKDYITSITLGGEVAYDKANGDANTTFKELGDYYVISVRVKSNEIADNLQFVVNYNTENLDAHSETYNVSVLKYLSYGLGYETVGTDLHNLYVSLAYYGIASANRFGATEGAVDALEAAVADYDAPEAIEEGNAGRLEAVGLGMALVLDNRLTYRVYVDDNAKWLVISYTALVKQDDGSYAAEDKTIEVDRFSMDDDGDYYYDLNLSAFDFIDGITITVMNGVTEDGTVEDYTINDYYADVVANGLTETTPPALLAAVRAYAIYANAYVKTIGK